MTFDTDDSKYRWAGTPYCPYLRNRGYSQWVGREELFERERGGVPDFQGVGRVCEGVCRSETVSVL
jgi:hypothetical protein